MNAGQGRGSRGASLSLAAISLGVLVSPLLPALPPWWFTLWAIPLALILLKFRHRLLLLFLAALSWSLLHYHFQLADRLDSTWAGQARSVEGTISSLPQDLGELSRFRFSPAAGQPGLPRSILVNWYRERPELRAGQQWRLDLRLKPPWGKVNFNGPDHERWLFANGIGGTGSVRSGQLLAEAGPAVPPAQEARGAVKEAIARKVDDDRSGGVVLALATADRSGISRGDTQLLRVTGTAHLLAISGLHIGLAAAGGMLLARALLWMLPLAGSATRPYRFTLVTGLAAGAAYAVLADLGVSTVRALLMLAAGLFAWSFARATHPYQDLVLARAVLLVADPLAPLGAGFWFSFLAVSALLAQFQPRRGTVRWWNALPMAQAAVFLVLLPVNAAWLGGFSLSGLPANLLAIPWVSFLVVPPVLAGVVALPLPDIFSGFSWSLAGLAISGLFHMLEWFGDVQPFLLATRSPGLPALLLACSGAVILLLPRGLPGRWTGLFLLLPLILPAPGPAGENELLVEALDVGQGTAVAVRTKNELVLYDTGPGDGAGLDQVGSAIAPMVAALGRAAPDRVVVSHGDLDHTGGLHSLVTRYPGVRLIGSVRGDVAGVDRCIAETAWATDGFDFRVLHPSAGLPYLRNNSSCVLSVSNGKAGILLSGDIEDNVENRLVAEGLGRHDLLLVPHHGSNSSSSTAFLDTVMPQAAIASAGLGNRFGFPRNEVRGRYAERGIELWSTGECGGIRVRMGGRGGLEASSARKQRKRIWRWPAAADCP